MSHQFAFKKKRQKKPAENLKHGEKGGHGDGEGNAWNIQKNLWSLLWIDPVIFESHKNIKVSFLFASMDLDQTLKALSDN